MTALLAGNQQFLDLCSNPPVFGLDGAFKNGYWLSRFVEEILVEIPARRLPGQGGERPIERVCVRANDGRLREHGECHAVVQPTELRDLLVRSRLLAAEIVRRKPQDHEPLVAITTIQFFQALVLRRVAAFTRRVNDKQYFSAELAERNRLIHQIGEFLIE